MAPVRDSKSRRSVSYAVAVAAPAQGAVPLLLPLLLPLLPLLLLLLLLLLSAPAPPVPPAPPAPGRKK